MFCHGGRRAPCRCVMRCHDRHARGAYPVASSGMTFLFPSPASGARRDCCNARSVLPVSPKPYPSACRMPFPPLVSFHSVPFFPERRDPDSRVSCARACAGAGARFAAARFARLIARTRGRQRAHLACRLDRGRSACAPARAGGGPRGLRLPRTHHSTVPENASALRELLPTNHERFVTTPRRHPARPRRRPRRSEARIRVRP